MIDGIGTANYLGLVGPRFDTKAAARENQRKSAHVNRQALPKRIIAINQTQSPFKKGKMLLHFLYQDLALGTQ